MYPGGGHSIAVIPPWEGVLDSSLAVCSWDRRSGWGWGIFCDLSNLVGGGRPLSLLPSFVVGGLSLGLYTRCGREYSKGAYVEDMMEGWPGPSLNWRAYACCIYVCRLSCSCTSSEGAVRWHATREGFESTKGTCACAAGCHTVFFCNAPVSSTYPRSNGETLPLNRPPSILFPPSSPVGLSPNS